MLYNERQQEKIKRVRKKKKIKNPPPPQKKIGSNFGLCAYAKKLLNYIQLRENFANLFLAIVVAKGLIDDILQSVSLALYMAHNSQRHQTWSRSKQDPSKRQKLNVYYTCPKIK